MAEAKGLIGGLAGVWLSSTIYAVAVTLRAGAPTWAAYVSLSGVAVLLLAYRAWRRGDKASIVLGSLLVLPMAAAGGILGALLGAGLASLLLLGLRGGGTLLILLGGAAIGGYPGLAVLAGGACPLLAVVPLAYHLVSISHATVRVTGDRSPAALALLGAAGLLVLVAPLSGRLPLIVVAADLASRAFEALPGPWRGLSIRAIGILETVRIVLVLLALGLLSPVSCF